MQVQLGPPAALLAGGGWRISGKTNGYLPQQPTEQSSLDFVTSTNATIEFKAIPGWNLPASQTVSLSLGGITTISNVFYTVMPPTLLVEPGLGLGISGTTGTVYQIQSRTSLASGAWSTVSTNTILSSGFNPIFRSLPGAAPARFYRAVWPGP